MKYPHTRQSCSSLCVAITTKYWKDSPGGGIKTYLLNLVDRLERQNINVKILFSQGLDSSQTKLSDNKLLFSVGAFLALRRIHPTVVHSQAYWYCLLPGVIYKLTYGCNLIHTFRSEPDRKMSHLQSFMLSVLINRCDRVTFVSKGLQHVIEDSYGLRFENPVITYPGVAPKEVSTKEIADFKAKYNIDESDTILLIQGFTANKLKFEGTKIVIESLKHLVHKYPNIKLIITRDGKYLHELKEHADHCMVVSNVIFTGDLSNPFVALYLCDIFLFPWLGESGVGNALLEAMSVGKPIIATSVNGQGVAEVISDNENGLLVRPDPESIAQNIELLLSNKELCATLGENAEKDARAKYSWETCTRAFLSLYCRN